MQVVFACPRCGQTVVNDAVETAAEVRCPQCEWDHRIGETDRAEGCPRRCVVCGCDDLWRQKDFPAKLGLSLVALGAVLSTVAWSFYRPLWAIGILMVFALFDLVLFAVMNDVLVCYRCGARHRHTRPDESVPRFNLEVAERYRQEAARLQEAGRSVPPS